jgi:thiosulfate/3-mercaptopyruvate sulfurtransferase
MMEQQANVDQLASPAWLAENLTNPSVRIVEVTDMRNPKAYSEGHIPGAICWPWVESLWHVTSRNFVPPEAFAELMAKSGITPDTTVVLYSNQFQYACYAFWVCTMRGHRETKVLHGNRDVWIGEKRPLTRDIPRPKRSPYPVRPVDETSRIGRDGVLTGLDNPDRVLLDLRTPEEFRGERVAPPWFEYDHGAVRKGHIPGARNLYYLELLGENETFRPVSDIRDAYHKRGATLTKKWFIALVVIGIQMVHREVPPSYPRARV